MTKSIKFHVDFASTGRFYGWAVDTRNQDLSSRLRLRSNDGVIFDLSKAKWINRIDVSKQFDYPLDANLGFDVNLLDAFNNHCRGYDLLWNDELIWSYADYISTLEMAAGNLSAELPRQYGGRQVVVVYKKDGWLHECLKAIYAWNPVYFDKRFQSGVSFLFVNSQELGGHKDNILKGKIPGILMVDRFAYRSIFSVSPTLISSWPLMILDRKIDLLSDFEGMLNTICSLIDLRQGGEINSTRLLDIMNALAAYADLLFDDKTGLYTFQSGLPAPWMKAWMHSCQEEAKADILLLSDLPISRLSHLSSDSAAIFVRGSALRFLVDAMNLESASFLKIAYKRGLRVRSINKEGGA